MFNMKIKKSDRVKAESTTKTSANVKKSEAETLLALKQMLDSMPVNVMTCELEHFTIDYVNETSRETLQGLEHLLPCKADDLLGQSIDIFHKAPEHQRKLLSDPNNLPWRTNIQLGMKFSIWKYPQYAMPTASTPRPALSGMLSQRR